MRDPLGDPPEVTPPGEPVRPATQAAGAPDPPARASGAADAAETLEAKTSADLEWPLLLEALARRCVGPLAAARLSALWPEATHERACVRMGRLAEAIELGSRGEPLPREEVSDLTDTLGRVGRGATASGLELRQLGTLLGVARRLRLFLLARRDSAPALLELLGTSAALDGLRDEIASCIEPDGRVSDAASSELREARRKVADLRRDLQLRLGKLARRYADVLRDQYWTEREGRHVLPVRCDAHERVEGIVHGSSASGATLYVEPLEVMQVGNGIKVAEAEAERADERVRAQLSDGARVRLPEISHALEACIDADVLGALAAWALECHAVALMPRSDAVMDLHCVQHPLLAARGVAAVPNDIAVRAGEALVISGPNAGGKTVALKCLGLIAWMARAGLPLPLDPRSQVGWMAPVLTDVGDDQSLLESLSTFSAHVAKLAVVLKQARPHALVLLDELAAGTDPEEGAALAVAVLEVLVQRGAAVVLTTHYERLKEAAAAEGPFRNASFGFDAERMTPTFRLSEGVPGSSSALAVAARYGIDRAVIERARALVPEAARAREQLALRLEQERVELERARSEIDEELARQRALREAMESERQRVREQERVRLGEQSRQITDAVRQAREELRRVRQQLSGSTLQSAPQLRDSERAIDAAARTVALGSPLAIALAAQQSGRATPPPSATPPSFAIGARVWLPKLGAEGEVVEAARAGRVRVQIGAMCTTVKVGDVQRSSKAARGGASPARAAREPGGRKAGPAAAVSSGSRAVGFLPVRAESNTVDLRGMRVEEGLERVDQFVDLMLRSGEPAAFVLHGHGTGAMKAAVREHLALSPWVTESRPADRDDGGDAFTLFWLRG